MDKIRGPHVAPADIEAEISGEYFFTAAEGVQAAAHCNNDAVVAGVHGALQLMTFCVLVLHNGHKVVGVNHGPVDPAEFDAVQGRKYAREAAIAKLWEPMGFRLRDQLARPVLTEADAAADLAGTPRPQR